MIEARPASTPAPGAPLAIEDDLGAIGRGVARFMPTYAELCANWRRRIHDVVAADGTVVIWGSGSKGVSFISNLELSSEITAAVDINPYKWGQFMVGSGHRIVSPRDLVDLQPDLVVVMNPIYVEEISAQLEELGVSCEVAAL